VTIPLTRRAMLAMPLALAPLPALAHHGFSGRYDLSRPIYLEGRVARASFRRPHPIITLAVASDLVRPTELPEADEFLARLVLRDEDRGARAQVEYPPVALFFDLAGRVREGDPIATIALRNCLAPHQLRGQWIRLADGSTVVRRGRMQTGVESCDAS
jgi:hypothetical protein